MADLASPRAFEMRGARAAMAAGLAHIEQHIAALESAIVANPALAFDLAKTLIETACKTILTARSSAFSENDDLPKIFKQTTKLLPLLPPSVANEAEVRRSLERTLSGLSTAVQGVCELRNKCGFASHGANGPRPALEGLQAILAAETADAIVEFLHAAHVQDRVPVRKPLKYEDNTAFNEYIDGEHDPVQVLLELFTPSKVLFELAPEAYRLHLAEFALELEAHAASAGIEAIAEGVEIGQ